MTRKWTRRNLGEHWVRKGGCLVYIGPRENERRCEAVSLPLLDLANCRTLSGIVSKLKAYWKGLHNGMFVKAESWGVYLSGTRLFRDDIENLLKTLEPGIEPWLRKTELGE